MGVTFSLFFPPKPSLTEANLPSQKGKVFIVTGGYSGIGYELSRILYQAGGKVYIAGRSEEKANAAIKKIRSLQPTSSSSATVTGELVFLPLSLDDLATIKPAVTTFTANESRLDVLFNNAGVSNPPAGTLSPQGYDLQFATNVLGPYLLTQLLLPILRRTATNESPASVRVIWTSSIVVDMDAPKGGLDLKELENLPPKPQHNYTITKLGNWFLAHALSAQVAGDGILSLTQNPGNLKTELTRHLPAWVPFLAGPLMHHPRYGAYTELWAGLSGDLKIEDGGKYVLPWGRLHPKPRKDLVAALKTKDEGGTGVAEGFVRFCDEKIAAFK
ncbi:putative steroid dehydrogenase [Xylogone sp. PMI_703]|nr:putative steroid dehydrogenase [Xylogone sp. PMI_703]